ncbi:hypothetical protein CR513_05358, partial [Mucuna pruriens]
MTKLPMIFMEEDESDLETLNELENLTEQENKVLLPNEDEVETGEEKKEVKVGTSIKGSQGDKLLKLLANNVDIFAWTYQDMPGLDPNIIKHKLPLNPKCSSVKQKLRRMKPKVSLKIKDEVKVQPNQNGLKRYGKNNTHHVVGCYKVMQFGLKNSRAVYQLAMVALFHNMMHN